MPQDEGKPGPTASPTSWSRTIARERAVIALWLLVALTTFPVYPHFRSPNELTRWALAASVVEHGTVEVSSLMPILGNRFEDLAEKDGRLYSNKPPGALVALPGYLAVRPLVGPPSREGLRVTITAMRIVASTLPLLLLALLFVSLGRLYDADPRWTVFLLLFATPLFPYSLLLFSHVLVAASLFGAWAMLFVQRRDVAAGALIGLAVISEYTAAVPAAVLVIALMANREWARLPRVMAGGAPFAILLGAYHQIAFGSPLRLSYFYERLPEFRAVAHSSFIPSMANVYHLLLDPGKGLFIFCPVLVLTIRALRVARVRLPPAAWWTLLLVPVAILLVFAGYPNWHGGWTVGPRYLVPAIPFLLFPFLFRKPDIADAILGGWSFLAIVVTTLVFPFVPNAFPMPWFSFAWPLLAKGLGAPNLWHCLAVPFALAAVAAALAIGGRGVVYGVIGALAAIVVGSLAIRLEPQPLLRMQRSYIEEVYFERPGAMQRAMPGVHVPDALTRRRDDELLVGPTSWPF